MISSSITDSIKTSGTSTTAGASAKNSLGKEAFMKLLVAQLQHQDPLKPMEDKDFTAQLAQFSSLEEMQNISKSVDTLASSQVSSAKTNSVGFIGKQVTANGGSVKISGGNPGPLSYELDKDASSVDVRINDASGKLVREIQGTDVSAGANSVAWDGRDSNGVKLQDGEYTFQIAATDKAGGVVQAKTQMTGVVNSVKYESGVPYLMLGSIKVPLSDVTEVK